MDMASVHALQACNIACYDKISETMLAAASSSGAGVVLVMDVEANKIFEVTVFESDGETPSPMSARVCRCMPVPQQKMLKPVKEAAEEAAAAAPVPAAAPMKKRPAAAPVAAEPVLAAAPVKKMPAAARVKKRPAVALLAARE
jgi:hypothetical protein